MHNFIFDVIDIGGWWFDDIVDGGLLVCSIGWGIVFEVGVYVVFYWLWMGIEFDFWDGDMICFFDGLGVEVDLVSYEGEDLDWDVFYGYDLLSGNWVKLFDGSLILGGVND